MSTINSVTLTPQTVLASADLLIEVSMTWSAITHNELITQTHTSLTVNEYDDFEGGVA